MGSWAVVRGKTLKGKMREDWQQGHGPRTPSLKGSGEGSRERGKGNKVRECGIKIGNEAPCCLMVTGTGTETSSSAGVH